MSVQDYVLIISALAIFLVVFFGVSSAKHGTESTSFAEITASILVVYCLILIISLT